ncbi:MAG: hypothetical protein COB67_02435 [SAR324 cluster bacterium]|uniref:Uncharacterized protein n=1 Tax=SAR324 cluster bacterium TaxID=2024889 RepID=A0A2A4T9E8_9DELT|nr:MAG: hypothetical protein COB67_02435 [SAR324 cluster bacterium]
MIKALLIDPFLKKVTLITLADKNSTPLQSILQKIDAKTITMPVVFNKDVILSNEKTTLGAPSFVLNGKVIHGKAILCGNDFQGGFRDKTLSQVALLCKVLFL